MTCATGVASYQWLRPWAGALRRATALLRRVERPTHTGDRTRPDPPRPTKAKRGSALTRAVVSAGRTLSLLLNGMRLAAGARLVDGQVPRLHAAAATFSTSSCKGARRFVGEQARCHDYSGCVQGTPLTSQL